MAPALGPSSTLRVPCDPSKMLLLPAATGLLSARKSAPLHLRIRRLHDTHDIPNGGSRRRLPRRPDSKGISLVPTAWRRGLCFLRRFAAGRWRWWRISSAKRPAEKPFPRLAVGNDAGSAAFEGADAGDYHHLGCRVCRADGVSAGAVVLISWPTTSPSPPEARASCSDRREPSM